MWTHQVELIELIHIGCVVGKRIKILNNSNV